MAVKVFRGDVSPDGQMVDEVDIACALDHPNLTRCPSPSPVKFLSCSPEALPVLRGRAQVPAACRVWLCCHAPASCGLMCTCCWQRGVLPARHTWSGYAARLLEAAALTPGPCAAQRAGQHGQAGRAGAGKGASWPRGKSGQVRLPGLICLR